MFGITKHKRLIITILCLPLIFIIGLFSFNINASNDDPHYLFNAKSITEALRRAKNREAESEDTYQLTAIILHWKRLSGVKKSIQNYLSTEFFKEIIIWNNNPLIKLTFNQILTNNLSSHKIRIINSEQNLKDEAKYLACSHAQTLACFYADDDWDASDYMKTLISSFRSDPNLLHSVTNAVTYYNNMLWTFMDHGIDLHTGFSWVGCGSIFLREHAQRHLQLLAVNLKANQGKLI